MPSLPTQVLRMSVAVFCSCATVSSPARAQVIVDPSPHNNTIPLQILIVGRDANNGVDPRGSFSITCRDFANVPTPGVKLRVLFPPASGARLCATQVASITAMQCDQAGSWVEGVSDQSGHWSATIAGCGATDASQGYAQIYGNGVLWGYARVAILDLIGCDGVGANDLSQWLTDFYQGAYLPRSDYDASGQIGANDLSEWLTAFGTAASAVGCGASICP